MRSSSSGSMPSPSTLTPWKVMPRARPELSEAENENSSQRTLSPFSQKSVHVLATPSGDRRRGEGLLVRDQRRRREVAGRGGSVRTGAAEREDRRVVSVGWLVDHRRHLVKRPNELLEAWQKWQQVGPVTGQRRRERVRPRPLEGGRAWTHRSKGRTAGPLRGRWRRPCGSCRG